MRVLSYDEAAERAGFIRRSLERLIVHADAGQDSRTPDGTRGAYANRSLISPHRPPRRGEDALTYAWAVGFDQASVPALDLMHLRFLPPRAAGEPVSGRRDGGPRFPDGSCGRCDIVFPINHLAKKFASLGAADAAYLETVLAGPVADLAEFGFGVPEFGFRPSVRFRDRAKALWLRSDISGSCLHPTRVQLNGDRQRFRARCRFVRPSDRSRTP